MALFGIFGAEFLLHFLCDSKHAFDVVFASYDESVVFAQTCTCGDQVTADNVFLHALEGIGLAVDCCFVEHLCGLLE